VPAELSKSPPHPPRILIVDNDPGQHSLRKFFDDEFRRADAEFCAWKF